MLAAAAIIVPAGSAAGKSPVSIAGKSVTSIEESDAAARHGGSRPVTDDDEEDPAS
jgi:hypothetical protein